MFSVVYRVQNVALGGPELKVLLLSRLIIVITLTGVSIKFEVCSWLEKSNRPYEQGAVRPLNLGGSGGMHPHKI